MSFSVCVNRHYRLILVSLAVLLSMSCACSAGRASAAGNRIDPKSAKLIAEVRNLGWIAYGSRTPKGDWDLFVMRPDGSHRRNITNTPDYNETLPRFSPDGRKLIYRRLPKSGVVDGNIYGAQGQLVIAKADGSRPVVYGKDGEYPWASWSPDGKQFACLGKEGIFFVDIATRKVLRRLNRKGIYQQLSWSPDGKWLAGIANMKIAWTVVRMNAKTGELNAVHDYQNCTPQWCPDSKRIIFANRPAGQPENAGGGWTQMFIGEGDGRNCHLVYGENGVHVYGNMPSPDGKYVVFTRSPEENGNPQKVGSPLSIMRLRDAPTIRGESTTMRKAYGKTKDGPIFQIPVGLGWGPCWAYARIRQR